MLDPGIFKAYDVRGLYGSELDEEGALRDRARVRRALRAPLDRRRPRHARLRAVDGRRGDGGRRRRRRRRPRPRDGRHRDGLLRGRRARASTAGSASPRRTIPKQYTGMKIVRAGALPVGGDSGLEDVRARRPGRLRPGREPRRDHAARRLAGLRRQGALVRRRRRDHAASDRRRRRQRDGRRDAAAGARAPAAGRGRPLLLRAGRHLPEPRAEPAARGEPRVHRREDAGGRSGARRRLRRGRRPVLLRRRHGRVRAGRLRHGAARRGDARQEPRRDRPLRRPRQLGRAAHDRRGRRHGDGQPRRPRVHQAPDARGARDLRRRGLGALLLPRLHPGRHRRRAVPAHARADLEARREALRDPAAVPREFFITGEINTPVADVPAQAAGDRAALRRRGRPRLAPRRRLGRLRHAGTSTCGRRTPSRSSASTSRRCPRRRWSLAATSWSP